MLRRGGATRCTLAGAAAVLVGVVIAEPPVRADALQLNQPIVAIASSSSGSWLAASDGGVFTVGNVAFHGSAGALRLNRPIVGIAATPTGNGYWLAASDGGIFSFGDATFYGSTGALRLNRPIVGIAATPTGNGYWLAASDGGIFSFGDATFYGSTGALRLNQPVVGIAATSTGNGYWLAASDGGIFSFGDAAFYGAGGTQSIVGIAGAGAGYWLASATGDVHAFGFARVDGAMHGRASASLVGIAPSGTGFVVVTPDGHTVEAGSGSTRGLIGAAAEMYQRVNDERAGRGIPALVWDPTLADAARAWSVTMKLSGFGHSNLGRLLGPYGLVGENIAAGSPGVTAGYLHGALMVSATHRATLLGPAWDRVGIGVYCAPDRSIWITENFGRTIAAGAYPFPPSIPPLAPVVRPDAGASSC